MAANGTDTNDASASKSCKKCEIIAHSGPKCSLCGTVSHNSCVSYLKNVKFLDDNTFICCEVESKCGDDLDITFSGANDGDYSEIYYLEEIISQKDLIIKNQVDVICSLKEQIKLMNKLQQESSRHPEMSKNHEINRDVTTPSTSNSEIHNFWNTHKSFTSKSTNLSPDKEKSVTAIDPTKPAVKQKTKQKRAIFKERRKDESPAVKNINESKQQIITGVAVSNAIIHAFSQVKCDELINASEVPFSEVIYKK
ncbi:hypothetical protein JTB14_018348 [Gonioctena quinquepunctata]|nr:hypothetical protein JTB14_018348 [Gonioctena quinquepunctata]